MKKYSASLSVGLLVLLLAACGGDESSDGEEQDIDNASEEEQPEEEDLPAEEAEEVGTEEADEEEASGDPHPLTGLPTEDMNDHRPLAVVINNHPQARPQTGLNEADLTYEILAEGSTTRFVSLFHSEEPDLVGPVRSARAYHLDLASGFDSLFVTHGWSPEAQDRLIAGEMAYLNGLNYDGTLFQRSADRPAPHDSYITYDDMLTGLDQEGYTLERDFPSLEFADEPAEGGEEAEEIAINYEDSYDVTFTYDPDNEVYTRASDGEETVDDETDEPLEVSNLLIAETDHQVVDEEGRRQIDLASGGQALLLQNGQVHDLEWENEDGQIVPVQNGEIVPFVPGSTWINIVPSAPGLESSVTYEDS
ncbi:DUF3048 domain-containing protein [Salsuginibacillus kocurii]|uniref:DUF3048 domain-containing protein n=1 Tax=Salsuginibacillus kocurii TaxID=427078 RepID=UPI000381769B|nr:DUF3048 domain-containing protein [Salsuginibacillus kocurii]